MIGQRRKYSTVNRRLCADFLQSSVKGDGGATRTPSKSLDTQIAQDG